MSRSRNFLALTVLLVVVVAGISIWGASKGGSTPTVEKMRHRVLATDPRFARWVIRENKKPGTTSWQITRPQSLTGIMGYADHVQAQQSQKITLYVSTRAASFSAEAFRMGYYGGKGARLIWRSGRRPGQQQAACPLTPGINMVQCHWRPSLSFVISKDWVPGEYLIKLVGSGGQQSYVPLTVWDPTSHATYVIMDGVLTTQVFNPFGGYDMYQGATGCAPNVYPCSSRARVVSFDRPYGYGNGAGTYLYLVYPLTRLAEQDGLNVTYWTDITLATNGALLRRHVVLISTGHDEEWSRSMRDAALIAAAHGVNLIFFGASAILRKVRLQPSPLGANRVIVNYRDPYADPYYGKNNAEVSQNQWVQPPANWSPGELLGANYIGYEASAVPEPLVVSDPSSWLFSGTGFAKGQEIPGVLSNDFQEYQPGTPHPPNVQILAHSPVQVSMHGAAYADTTYFTMPKSLAGVWQSGTTEWIPSLRPCSRGQHCAPGIMRVLTNNLLRVFGTGPVGRRYPSVSNAHQFGE